MNYTDEGVKIHNKPFTLLLRVNLSVTYAILVNKCKVKFFNKQRPENAEKMLSTATLPHSHTLRATGADAGIRQKKHK